LSYYLGVLGDTGLSAYFGLTDIGRPQPGETVLVSAAGGAVASYGRPQPGPSNLFQLVTRQASMRGFLTHTQAHRYPEARAERTRWIQAGDIVAPEYLLAGIDQVGQAFSDLFAGRNFGKTVVKLC
jgi:NADPH-dependent curcumin reductase CurA